jgi:hypothetical protein
MNDAQRSAIRSLLAASESPADAIRAMASFLGQSYADALEVDGPGWDAGNYALESLGEAAIHAEAAELETA